MTRLNAEEREFADGLAAAEAMGTVALEIDVTYAVALVVLIQLAGRHPGTRGSPTMRQGEQLARLVQDELARRAPTLGRLLERGWHEAFDR